MSDYLEQDDTFVIKRRIKEKETGNLLTISTLLSFFKSKMDQDLAEDESMLLRLFPNNNFLYTFLNIGDNRYIKKVSKLALTPVSSNVKLYFASDNFTAFLENKNTYNNKWQTLRMSFALKSLFQLKPFPFVDMTKKNAYEFKIRFLSNFDIPFNDILTNKLKITQEQRNKIKRIVFHFHGGGFVCMSSSTHQNYLRRFCKNSEACVFSVDYPLAPLKRYKNIIEICFKSYIYVLVCL